MDDLGVPQFLETPTCCLGKKTLVNSQDSHIFIAAFWWVWILDFRYGSEMGGIFVFPGPPFVAGIQLKLRRGIGWDAKRIFKKLPQNISKLRNGSGSFEKFCKSSISDSICLTKGVRSEVYPLLRMNPPKGGADHSNLLQMFVLSSESWGITLTIVEPRKKTFLLSIILDGY